MFFLIWGQNFYIGGSFIQCILMNFYHVLSSPPQKKRDKGKIYEVFKAFDLKSVTKELNNLGWIRGKLL